MMYEEKDVKNNTGLSAIIQARLNRNTHEHTPQPQPGFRLHSDTKRNTAIPVRHLQTADILLCRALPRKRLDQSTAGP